MTSMIATALPPLNGTEPTGLEVALTSRSATASSSIDYEVACTVQESWDRIACNGGRKWLKKTADIFLRCLLEILPQQQDLPSTTPRPSSSKMQKDGARAFILAVDQTVSACDVGDMAALQDDLLELGQRQRHNLILTTMKASVAADVDDSALRESSNNGFVVKAFLLALEEMLGSNNFERKERQAWKIVLDVITYWMMEGCMAAPPSMDEEEDEFDQDTMGCSSRRSSIGYSSRRSSIGYSSRRRRRSSVCTSIGSGANSSGMMDESSRRRRGSLLSISTRMSIGMSQQSHSTRRSRSQSLDSDDSCLSYHDYCERQQQELEEESMQHCYEEDNVTNIYEPLAAMDVDFTTVALVVESWKGLTNNTKTNRNNWQKDCGTAILKRLFQLVPSIKTAWGFPCDFDPSDATMPKKYMDRFQQKGVGFIMGIDKAISLLEMSGPDLEPLQDELQDLGKIHYLHMSAQPHHWPPMGIALMETLENVSSSSSTSCEAAFFNEETKQAWGLIYHFLSYWMIEGVLEAKREESC